MSNTIDHQGQTNPETLQTYWSAMDRYDIDAALETLDTACVIHIPASLPYGGIYQGHEKIRQFWSGGFFQLYEKPEPIGLQLLVSGDRMITLQILKTRLKGSSVELEMPMAETFKLRDGKIVEIRPYYFDTLKMVQVFKQRGANASE